MDRRVICENDSTNVIGLRLTLDFERTQVYVPTCVVGRQVFVVCDENYFVKRWIAEHKEIVLALVASQTGLKVRDLHIYVDSHK